MIVIPNNRLGHIFRESPGHLPDTLENRRALVEMSSSQENLAGYDRRGHAWYALERGDGTQLWAVLRGNEIINGGLNATARRFNLLSGLSRSETKT